MHSLSLSLSLSLFPSLSLPLPLSESTSLRSPSCSPGLPLCSIGLAGTSWLDRAGGCKSARSGRLVQVGAIWPASASLRDRAGRLVHVGDHSSGCTKICIIKFFLPNEITPLPTNMHSLPTFSIFAQTPPFYAQTPLIFAQPSRDLIKIVADFCLKM